MTPARPELRLAVAASSGPSPGPSPGPSDDALMALAQAGDARAFGRLVERHEPRLRRVAALLVGDPSRASDLVQDALVAAWEKCQRYRPDPRAPVDGVGGVRAWLLAFVRNVARRERRKLRFRASFGLGTLPAWVEPEPEPLADHRLAAADRDRVLTAALGRLPDAMREALVLRYVEGLDYDTIAALVGTSASTLRSRVHHGLARLGPLVPEELLR